MRDDRHVPSDETDNRETSELWLKWQPHVREPLDRRSSIFGFGRRRLSAEMIKNQQSRTELPRGLRWEEAASPLFNSENRAMLNKFQMHITLTQGEIAESTCDSYSYT